MAQLTSCPQCQRTLNVPHSLQGQAVKCPGCGTVFTAGEAAGGPTWPDPPPAPPPPYQPPPPLATPEPPPQPAAPPRRRSDRYDDEEDEDDYYEEPRRRRRRRHRRRDLLPHRGGMVLTLGILSLASYLLVIFCAFFGLIPIIMGPIAWIMGAGDLRSMREGRMDPDGEGQTRAGFICGMVATILFLFGFMAAIFIFLLLMANGRFR